MAIEFNVVELFWLRLLLERELASTEVGKQTRHYLTALKKIRELEIPNEQT